MRFGYARVSTKEQNLDRQLDQLAAANVDRVFSDKISGAKESRPELDKMLSMLREGDTVIVCSYDRLARSSKQLFDLAERFNANGHCPCIPERGNGHQHTARQVLFCHVRGNGAVRT